MKTYHETEHALATLIADVAKRAMNGETIMGMQIAGDFMERNCQGLEELGEISDLFPEDAPHKHKQTGVSLLDDVRDLVTASRQTK